MVGAARPFGPGCALLRLCRYEAVREIVLAIRNGERRPHDLRHRRNLAHTTLYNHVAQLFALGIVVRHEVAGPPWRVFFELGTTGAEFERLLLGWADLLSYLPGAAWDAPLHFAEAWGAAVVPALLAGPLTVAQVAAVCAGRATVPQVERLLRQLRGEGFLLRSGHRYAVNDAARIAIGELAATARFERRHMEAAPITVTDAADALRGTLPLVALPGRPDGICEFVVRATRTDPGPRAAVCWARFETGQVVACGAGHAPGTVMLWVQGTIDEWMAAVIDRQVTLVRSVGERRLGRQVVRELHSRLYERR